MWDVPIIALLHSCLTAFLLRYTHASQVLNGVRKDMYSLKVQLGCHGTCCSCRWLCCGLSVYVLPPGPQYKHILVPDYFSVCVVVAVALINLVWFSFVCPTMDTSIQLFASYPSFDAQARCCMVCLAQHQHTLTCLVNCCAKYAGSANASNSTVLLALHFDKYAVVQATPPWLASQHFTA